MLLGYAFVATPEQGSLPRRGEAIAEGAFDRRGMAAHGIVAVAVVREDAVVGGGR